MHTPIHIYTGRTRRQRRSRKLWLTLLAALGLVLLFTGLAHASTNQWINEAEAGVFLLKDANGEPQPALMLDMEADVQISGPIAQVRLTQVFRNPGNSFVEGLYVFPLPENAAVHAMELRIGERRIVGEIHEKQAAKKIYEQARAEGKRTGLVEQRRANVFTTSVANIAPGEQIAVQLDYIEVLHREGNRFSFRLPMTLTPRYRPALVDAHSLDVPVDTPVDQVLALASESGLRAIVPDVSGSFHQQNAALAQSNQARLRISLNGGVSVSQLYSRSHQVEIRQQGDMHRILPWDASVPMDRDFLLNWQLKPAGGTEGVMFTETVDGVPYGLLMLVPPRQVSSLARLPREMLFIIDTSGSMGGESIRQARAALLAALDRLHPGDRFNIIEFDDQFSTLYPQPVPAADDTLSQARYFVRRLEAGGGTEMLNPLRAALTMHGEPGYLRQVLFITDGAVANEHAIFSTVHNELGDARLFTVGIGSAPNSYFMRKAAEFGRGTFTYISDTGEVSEQMAKLFARLEKPLMRDITVTLPEGINAELFPDKVPDLYADEPIMVAMKFNRLPDRVQVQGQGISSWSQTVRVSGTAQHPGTSILWAREKIEALMDRMVRGEEEAVIRPQVLDVALRHRLVSRYTSFVAVDRTPVRPADAPLHPQQVANRLPHGLSWPKTATGVDQLWLLSAWLLLACLLMGLRLWSTRHETA